MQRPLLFAWIAASAVLLRGAHAAIAEGPGPLEAAKQVDALLAQELFQSAGGATVELAPRTNDETFLRRVTLDLTGTLPSPGDVTAFALDRSPDKRAAVVAHLLADSNFGRNWARYWRDVILYRRNDERALLAARPAETYLTEKFNANAPWDAIARSFVTATGDVREEGRTAIIMAQMGDVNDVTSEMSRILLGVQIQCAQCHDHPTDRWKRQQFHELAAFFPRVQLRRRNGAGMLSFEVASFDDARRRRPQGMVGARGELEHYMPDLNDPTAQGALMTPRLFLSGQQLAEGETDLERRQALANWMTDAKNPWFAKAFVNRIWAELVGEGFYEPVDDLGPDRKCSAPAAMEALAGQFAARQFDVKWLFQTIVATAAYQRESRPRRNPDQIPFTANCSQRLRSDQIYDALYSALGGGAAAMSGPRQRPAGPYGLGGPRALFGAVFGYDPSDRREEISGSIPQALLLMNSPLVNQAIHARRPDHDLGRLLAETRDDDDMTGELYLRCLAREPNDKELAACRDYVGRVGDRAEAYEDIFWALVNSAEFLHRN
jgi:hypothetical protein